jgi:predicted kinase
MICGPVGVGKTTYSIALAQELGAVRFSIDDWLSELFFPDQPDPLTYDWAVARARRCETRILAVSHDILALGRDVIWDMGFMERDQRARVLAAVAGTPYSVRLHALEAPADVRRARVAQRNIDKPEGYVMDVTDEIFDFMENRSGAVSDDEAADIVRVDTSSEESS